MSNHEIQLEPFLDMTTKVILASEKAVDAMLNDENRPMPEGEDVRWKLLQLYVTTLTQLINGNFVGNALFDIGSAFEAAGGDDDEDEVHFFKGGKN